jgi:CxxC motif-containing protein
MATRIKFNGETYNVYEIGDQVKAVMDTRNLDASIEYSVIAKTEESKPYEIVYTLTNPNAGITGLVQVRNGHILLKAA